MNRILRPFLLSLALMAVAAGPLRADCYADYKAKQDNPLRLQYGVIALSDPVCANPAAARQEVARRLSATGWQLLNVVSVFGPEGLEQRRASAGSNFLRY